MAQIEDMLKGNLLFAAGIGMTALVLPRVLPALPPAVRSTVKSGLSLFMEAESEAEGDIIDRLAESALKNVLQGLSGAGSESDRHAAAQTAVEHFKHTARRRAARYAHSESDRSARYRRHVAVLRHALRQERASGHGVHTDALGRLLDGLDKA